jgi:uncharacterized protein (AIM24 family)
MKTQLMTERQETTAEGHFVLENPRLLKIRLDGAALARQGAMVAYQGEIDFDFEGAGVGRFFKKVVTGENLQLMRCSGRGDVFLAHDAREIYLIELTGDGLSVSADNLLAFDDGIEWDINRIQGAGVTAGGLFNTTLRGSGLVAVSCHGTPVTLDTSTPTFVDSGSAVAWSLAATPTVKSSFKAKALIGRGSGELVQLRFDAPGFVVVQASEGPTVPEHTH